MTAFTDDYIAKPVAMSYKLLLLISNTTVSPVFFLIA